MRPVGNRKAVSQHLCPDGGDRVACEDASMFEPAWRWVLGGQLVSGQLVSGQLVSGQLVSGQLVSWSDSGSGGRSIRARELNQPNQQVTPVQVLQRIDRGLSTRAPDCRSADRLTG